MWIIIGIITGIAAVLVGLLFRHAGLVLFALLAWWVHGWLTTDRIREHHQIELRNEEYAAVQGQRLKVLAKNVEVVFEKYGDHEVRATIENGSVARISDIQLKCSYERPYEDEPWKLTSPWPRRASSIQVKAGGFLSGCAMLPRTRSRRHLPAIPS